MSLMIVKVAPWRPARFRILRRIGCGTEPKASRRSSHTTDAGFFSPAGVLEDGFENKGVF